MLGRVHNEGRKCTRPAIIQLAVVILFRDRSYQMPDRMYHCRRQVHYYVQVVMMRRMSYFCPRHYSPPPLRDRGIVDLYRAVCVASAVILPLLNTGDRGSQQKTPPEPIPPSQPTMRNSESEDVRIPSWGSIRNKCLFVVVHQPLPVVVPLVSGAIFGNWPGTVVGVGVIDSAGAN